MKIEFENKGWKPMITSIKRAREDVAKMYRALEEDYIKGLIKPSGLPKDWRNRILK